ncbi:MULTISPECIES: hypothetical protein [Marinovum]|uniref:hypothetical protein n=1 Tax=Marinovum TaxID=367771 RepID=UPI00237C33CD|nr:hypothetical protein [Marinovum sp. PR37]MDD9746817.1 hypothetical protein [Marinovum sp. PR37]
MRRVIGIDIHRTFGEVVVWENGLTRHEGRIEMTYTALEGFGRQLKKTDEAVIEATGNCMAVCRVALIGETRRAERHFLPLILQLRMI